MRLKAVSITNFRCYKETFRVPFNDFTAIIGKNDVGKSTILDALSIFFERESLEANDRSIDSENSEVIISCTFDLVPSQIIIDADYPTSLENEYLLNGEGCLEIIKRFDCSGVRPKLKYITARAVHPTNDGYGDLLSLKRQELSKRAGDLGVDLGGVNKTINAEVRSAIWRSTDTLALSLKEIDLQKEAGKQVWTALVSIFLLSGSSNPIVLVQTKMLRRKTLLTQQ